MPLHLVVMGTDAVHPEYARLRIKDRKKKFKPGFWKRVKIHAAAINAAMRDALTFNR